MNLELLSARTRMGSKWEMYGEQVGLIKSGECARNLLWWANCWETMIWGNCLKPPNLLSAHIFIHYKAQWKLSTKCLRWAWDVCICVCLPMWAFMFVCLCARIFCSHFTSTFCVLEPPVKIHDKKFRLVQNLGKQLRLWKRQQDRVLLQFKKMPLGSSL